MRAGLGRIEGVLARARLEDLFTFAIAFALVRQLLWPVGTTAAALLLSAVAAGAAVAVVRRSAQDRPSPPRVFWLVVALPVLLLWAVRAPLPDIGYDVLNYHLMHGERALRGPLFPPGDFFPYFFPYLDPSGDMVLGLFRWVLGYRLGTVANPLVLVWTGTLVWRLLAREVADERCRAAAVLLVLASEGLLWEVSSYMVDLLALPLLLEATLRAVEDGEDARPLARRTASMGLLLGAAVALKLTNLVFAAPIGALALFRWLRRGGRAPAVAGALACGAVASAAPIAPHAATVFLQTGSPTFPYFNGIFAAPLYPPADIKDLRWGPASPAEALVWPFLSALQPGRLSEMETTTGRVALGWLASLAALALFPRDRKVRGLVVISLASGLFWSLGTGYQRYGLFCELLGGVMAVLVAARLSGAGAAGEGSPPARPSPKLARGAGAVIAGVLALQSAWAFVLVRRSDWSGRPTVFHAPPDAAREALFSLRDHDLASFLDPGSRQEAAGIGLWVDAASKTNGIMTLLNPRAAMIGLQVEGLFWSPANLALFDDALRACQGRRAASLAFVEDADAAEDALYRKGFTVRSRRRVDLPFFSPYRKLELVLFDVDVPPPLPPGRPRGPRPEDGLPAWRAKATPWREDPDLLGSIDEPRDGVTVRGDLFVRGWAREPGEDLLVTVLVDGVEAPTSRFRRVPRPDVAGVLRSLGDCSHAGYEATVPFRPGAAGDVRVSVLLRSRDGRERWYPPVRIRWSGPESGATRKE